MQVIWQTATATAIAALAAGLPALAQTAGPSNDTLALDEIVVTANKRAQKLSDVPTALTVIGGDTLEASGAVQFSQYFDTVPGLAAVSFGQAGKAIVSIRGITTGAAQANATVGTYINDVPFGSAGGLAIGGTFIADPNTFDVERIEVLKGPQGTLYGASTLGGLIKTVYAGPKLGETSGRVMLDVNAVDGGTVGGAANGMVNLAATPELAIRAVASWRRDAGFIDSVAPTNLRKNANSADAFGGRIIALYQPNPQFSAELTAIYQRTESNGVNQVDLDPVTLRPTRGDLKTGETFIQPFNDLEYQIYSAKLGYDFGPVTLTSISSYGRYTEDSRADQTNAVGLGPVLPFDQNIGLKNFTQEVRLASPTGDRFEWLLGGFYTKQDNIWNFNILGRNPVTLAPLVPTFNFYTFDTDSHYREIAGFGNATFNLTDRLGISGGLRYSHNKQNYRYGRAGLVAGNVASETFGRSSDNVVTYSASIQYKPTEGSLIYAKTANGYRPGGPQVSNLAGLNLPTEFKPDKTRNYELGARWTGLDNRLSLDVNAFYIDWQDIQLLTTVVVTVSGQPVRRSLITNAGSATSKGFDFALRYRPIPDLTATLAGGYTDASLDEPAPSLGASARERIPYTPRWQFTGGLEYGFDVGSARGNVGATARYVGERTNYFSADPGGNIRAFMPDYVLLDLRADVTFDQWEVAARINNVTNRRAILATFSNAFDSNPPFALVNDSGVVAQPRTFGLSLTRRF